MDDTLRPREDYRRAYNLILASVRVGDATEGAVRNQVWQDNRALFAAMLQVLCWAMRMPRDEQFFDEFLLELEDALIEAARGVERGAHVS